MAYRTKTATFDDYLSALEGANKFAWSMFCAQELAGTIEWERHLAGEVEASQDLINRLERFLARHDTDLLASVRENVGERTIYKEVLEHFSQDKDPLTLEQEFEAFVTPTAGDLFQERYDMWANEY